MELTHYTEKELVFNRSRTYYQGDLAPYNKPFGFWVGVTGENDWASYCADTGWADLLRVKNVVELSAFAKVLIISNVEEFDIFDLEYGVNQSFGSWKSVAIDWERVATDYSGIIIAPYLWSRRMTDWYYGWDCASGCIWDLSAIKNVKAEEKV